mmetsp:Transcript_24603/g.54693  ORF Transcript_24603/g.54693 Transcript_24603/m.54693 type:complete len:159 (+) Transcript_24603:182-658(+)
MEQVLLQQHVRLMRTTNYLPHRTRKAIEYLTLTVALLCALSLFVLHLIYITNSSNARVNCLLSDHPWHLATPGPRGGDYLHLGVNQTHHTHHTHHTHTEDPGHTGTPRDKYTQKHKYTRIHRQPPPTQCTTQCPTQCTTQRRHTTPLCAVQCGRRDPL